MPVTLSPPSSVWLQLASFSFILCGIHNDLLVIRFYVSLSYILILVSILIAAKDMLQLDNLLWSLLGLYVNGTSLVCLWRDERPVLSLTDDQAALWRLLYRSGGFSQRLFAQHVAPYLQIRSLPAGETIQTQDYFYIVYTGQVYLTVTNENSNSTTYQRTVQSGQMFDLRFLDFFSEYSDHFFHQGDIVCTTKTPTKLFCFSRQDIRRIAHLPMAKGVWQSLMINDLSITAEQFAHHGDDALRHRAYDPIFDPLQPWELPAETLPGSGVAWQRPLQHFSKSLWQSLLLPWPLGEHPVGVRQTLLPAPKAKPVLSSQGKVVGHRNFYRRAYQTQGNRSSWSLMVRSYRVRRHSEDILDGDQANAQSETKEEEHKTTTRSIDRMLNDELVLDEVQV